MTDRGTTPPDIATLSLTAWRARLASLDPVERLALRGTVAFMVWVVLAMADATVTGKVYDPPRTLVEIADDVWVACIVAWMLRPKQNPG